MTTLTRRRSIAAATVARIPKLYAPDAKAAKRFLEYFAAHIRNANTRRAYFRAVREFSNWCERNKLTEIVDVEPVHVAAYIEQMGRRLAKPSVKQHLAAFGCCSTGWSWARSSRQTRRRRFEVRSTLSVRVRPPF